MKKYLSVILAVVVVAMLSLSAFAAPTTESVTPPGNQYIDVTLGISGDIGHRYSIDIEYTGNMTFSYNKTGMEWTVGENGYSYNMSETGWTSNSQTLTVYNHSDLALRYTVTMAKAAKYNALTFTLNGAAETSSTLPACQIGTAYRSINSTVDIEVSGTVPFDAANGDKLGQLTVAFSEAP